MMMLAPHWWTSVSQIYFGAIVEFTLQRPVRRGYAAVYQAVLPAEPRLVVDDEASDFHWWDPCSPVPDDLNALDAEIGRRVFEGPSS